MSEEYTVPALREAVEKLRGDADKLLAGAEIQARQHVENAQKKAAGMRAAAAEIEADANAKEQRQQPGEDRPPFTVPCWNCNQPTMKDPLGWRHAPGVETACQVPGPDEHEANRTAVARTDGEVAQS
jgi:hypothetical protein